MTSTNDGRAPRALGLVLGLALALAACGSSGGTPGGKGGAGGGGGGTNGNGGCQSMSWLDDGASECADFVSLTRSTSNGFDQLAATGTMTTGVGITFKVIVPGGGAVETGKAYACDGVYIIFVYQAGAVASHTTVGCTITITDLGDASTPAMGTFSAMLTATDGTPKQITSGAFSAVPKIAN